MHPLISLFAVLGFLALSVRVLRSWAAAARHGVDAFAARALAETRAQHGDVTGMNEARNAAEQSRLKRRRAVGGGIVWGALLIIPALTLEAARLYAAASVLWLPVLAGRGAAGR